MRIIFMGTPDFAVPSLNALIEGPDDDVVAVITQPDRAKGRHDYLSPPPVKILAQQHNIPVYQPEKVKDKSFLPQLMALNPDLIVVVAYGQILSRDILDIPPKRCINIHASLLPKYRGSAPINWALINGEKVTGVTSMIVSEALDSGPIFLKKEVAIGEDDDFKTLHDKLSKAGGELLSETINGIRKGDLMPLPQNEAEATYFPLLKKSDGLIDWHKKAEEIENRIRGLNPWPGTYTYLQKQGAAGVMLKIFKADLTGGQWPVVAGQPHLPGTILDISDKGIVIATGEECLSIKELQLEGKRRMGVAEFVKGHKIEKGMVFGS